MLRKYFRPEKLRSEDSLKTLGRKEEGINMTGHHLNNNTFNINTDMTPLQLPIEEPLLSYPNSRYQQLVLLFSSIRNTSVGTPPSPSVTYLGSLVNPPSKVNLYIIGIEAIKYLNYHQLNIQHDKYCIMFVE